LSTSWRFSAGLALALAASAMVGVHGRGRREGPTAAPRAGQEDFAAIFGERYVEAANFLEKNAWIRGALRLSPEGTRLALAVVFPEIIRWSAIEDQIQVRALKVLYVQYGPEYANFSIGRFQMKPSFIEFLEADWNRLASAEEKAETGIPAFAPGDTRELRRNRILRLDDLRWQVTYLRAFMLVMEKRYGRIAFRDADDRVRFYATAYNAGYAAGAKRLRQEIGEKRFYTELFFPKTTYNYADIAVFFYRRGY
jgi:hypothetical protein